VYVVNVSLQNEQWVSGTLLKDFVFCLKIGTVPTVSLCRATQRTKTRLHNVPLPKRQSTKAQTLWRLLFEQQWTKHSKRNELNMCPMPALLI